MLSQSRKQPLCLTDGLIFVCVFLVIATISSTAMAEEPTPSNNVTQASFHDSTAWPGADCESCLDIETGVRAPVIDGVGWVFGIPRKILLWDRRADNHDVSPATVDEVAQYIDARELHDVKVRVNQYAPGGEWKRLVANKRVGAGWRYTVGALSTLGYTLLPGRLFGHDHYNPYTNTLSVYSDAPTLALAEAAYAKDVHQRDLPGTYATAQLFPLVAMWHETLATGEVLDYVSIRGSKDEQEDVKRQLYARYGMELGGAVGGALPDGSFLFPIVGAAGGHAVASVENTVHPQPTATR